MAQAILTGLAILPVGIDGVGSYLGFWESSQFMRILSGCLVGAIAPGFLLLAGNFDPKGENTAAIYEKNGELLALMGVSAAFGLCLWAGLPFMGIGAVFSIVGEVLLWGGLVWLVLKNLRKDKPCWGISLLISFGGLFLMGGLV